MNKKQKYMHVKLLINPNEEQKEDLKKLFSEFEKLCSWLDAEAPKEFDNFHRLRGWAYGRLRSKGAFAMLCDKIISKVSAKRMSKIPDAKINPMFIMFDCQMFGFRNGVLSMRFWADGDKTRKNGRQVIEYSILSGVNTKSQIASCIPQSGVLRQTESGDYLFDLRVYPPKVMAYLG